MNLKRIKIALILFIFSVLSFSIYSKPTLGAGSDQIDFLFFDNTVKHEAWKIDPSIPSDQLIIRQNGNLPIAKAGEKGKFKFNLSDEFKHSYSGFNNSYNIFFEGELDLKKSIREYRIDKRELSGKIILDKNGKEEIGNIKGFWEGTYNPRSYILYGRYTTNIFTDIKNDQKTLSKNLKNERWRGQIKGIFSTKILPYGKTKKRKYLNLETKVKVLEGSVVTFSYPEKIPLIVNRECEIEESYQIFVPKNSLAEIRYLEEDNDIQLVRAIISSRGNLRSDYLKGTISTGTNLWVDVNYPGNNFRIESSKGVINTENANFLVHTSKSSQPEFILFVFRGTVSVYDKEKKRVNIIDAYNKAEMNTNGQIVNKGHFGLNDYESWWLERTSKEPRGPILILREDTQYLMNLFNLSLIKTFNLNLF